MTQTRGNTGRARANDDRSEDERQSIRRWSPAQQLAVPHSTQVDFCWVAEHVNGFPVPQRAQRFHSEGWDFVSRSSLPDDFLLFDQNDQSDRVRYGGFILMQLHKTEKARRDAYIAERRRRQLAGANQLQGIAGRDAVEEDRGTRSYDGEEAARALQSFNAG